MSPLRYFSSFINAMDWRVCEDVGPSRTDDGKQIMPQD